MQRAVLAAVGGPGHEDLAVVLLDVDVAGHALGQLALGALHAHELRLERDLHAVRHGDRLPSDPAHGYQTLATSSPPTRAARASWPVITPCEVEMIAVPMPPKILGIVSAST